MEKYLKPLAKKVKRKPHAVIDIESNSWTEFEMGGYYDGLIYRHCDTLDELVTIILSKRNHDRVIFAHNGGRFDFLFIMEYLKNVRNKEVKIIAQGARIVALKIHIGRRHYVHLQDSFSLLPQSLHNLSRTFNVSVKKETGAIDFERERVSKHNELHRAYLRSDCESLWQVLREFYAQPFIRDIDSKITLASTSLAAWRTTLNKPIRVTTPDIQNFVRESYAGGRCEIFKQVMGIGECVDVNSLYPFSMLNPLPVEHVGASHDAFDFGFHDCTVRVPDCYMPILWKKTTKLIFPTGTFRGTFFSEELKLAVEQGAVILKHHRGEKFTKETDLFKTYIEHCYTLRKENKGTALDLIAKLLMNNTYGKFAEREEKKSLLKVDQTDPATWPREFAHFHSDAMFRKTGLIEVIKNKRSPHMLCHIASAITAWSRIHMARELYIPRQQDLCYTDTDSGFLSGQDNFRNSGELGEFKQEYKIKNAFFLLPKGYYIETDTGQIIKKLKGFSKKSLESISYDLFVRGNIKTVENKLAGFRTALIRKNAYLALCDQKKSVITEYNKRVVLRNGDTRPWHITKNGVVK